LDSEKKHGLGENEQEPSDPPVDLDTYWNCDTQQINEMIDDHCWKNGGKKVKKSNPKKIESQKKRVREEEERETMGGKSGIEKGKEREK
jgi:hypothetical protein